MCLSWYCPWVSVQTLPPPNSTLSSALLPHPPFLPHLTISLFHSPASGYMNLSGGGGGRVSAIIDATGDIRGLYCTARRRMREMKRKRSWRQRRLLSHDAVAARTRTIGQIASRTQSKAQHPWADMMGQAELNWAILERLKGVQRALCPHRQISAADVWLSLPCYGVFHR